MTKKTRPSLPKDAPAIRVVDLFAGCGGLTLGVRQAAAAARLRVEVPLAIDFEPAAVSVYRKNFPDAHVVEGAVEETFDGALGAPLTATESALRREVQQTHLLMGGPPCQGHSNLNNKTRRRDPKNVLYARMGRAAEVLTPNFVLIENVPSVRFDTDQVVQTTVGHLEQIGYRVETATIALHPLGVAQTRRRHVVLASRVPDVDPAELLAALVDREPDGRHDLRWAIGDLATLAQRVGYDVAPTPSDENLARMRYLLDADVYDLPNDRRPICHQDKHSYKSMYGRLSWDEPAQTITSGFGSIGQGRYMHPDQPRALTAHEAARIQGFPDYFSFDTVSRRSDIATMIGNAVPPALTRELVAELIPGFDIAMPKADDPAAESDALGGGQMSNESAVPIH
ncbi:DNA cytosine methyltransferase [Curtobacterium sp. MCLR17_040]|uniref:DNA cytosine methyltransferase n=1 Tax=Curtobacterium sp. MCLR17_040 TaxID=2175625 RepID=UPI0015E89E61|nr:DNA cytosine methyltransferase [Curtobacterium sp. MCLR17_040]